MIPSVQVDNEWSDVGSAPEIQNFGSMLYAAALVFGLLTGVVLNWLSRTRVAVNG